MPHHLEITLHESLVHMAENLPLFEELSFKDSLLKDITMTEVHTITLIGKLGAPKMSELAESAHVTQGTMTGMVNKLVKKEYVKRMRGAADRRVVRVELTTRGRKIDKLHEEHHMSLVEKISGALTRAEQREMVRLMKKVAGTLE
jgi:DNA-binding MarR family transcriptional regulator